MIRKKIIKLNRRSWLRMKSLGYEGIELSKYPHTQTLYFFKFGDLEDLQKILTWGKTRLVFFAKEDPIEGVGDYTTDPRVRGNVPEYIFHLK